MASRPKQPQPRPTPRLYLITPRIADAAAFTGTLASALASADIAAVLLRLEQGDERTLINQVKTLAPIAQDNGAAALIDGHAELAARAGADGAHLSGIAEFSAALAQLKPDRIAGAGALASRHDVMLAAETGADYVMFGGLERGATADPAALIERVGWYAEVFELPCVAYAAERDAIAPLVAAGADFIAVDFVWDDPRGAAAALADAANELRLPEPAR